MTLSQLEQSCVLFAGMAWSPRVAPVDYGGFLVCRLSMHLSDGTALTHSSCETDAPDEGAKFDAALALLRARVLSGGVRPRSDYLDADKTLAYWALTGRQNTVRCAVSACLCGECCRYDGGGNRDEAAARLFEAGLAVPVCPEVLGGLPVPRPPCELRGGRALGRDGEDRTAAFTEGARRALLTARKFGAAEALLKARSPSCGRGGIYDGSFTRRLTGGDGLAAALFLGAGIRVRTEEEGL